MDNEGNTRFNKDIKKNMTFQHQKKLVERRKMEKFSKHH